MIRRNAKPVDFVPANHIIDEANFRWFHGIRLGLMPEPWCDPDRNFLRESLIGLADIHNALEWQRARGGNTNTLAFCQWVLSLVYRQLWKLEAEKVNPETNKQNKEER